MSGATPPTWTIMVPTIGERRSLFERLIGALLPQVEAAEGQVKILAWYNNGSPSLPDIRQEMNHFADTDYVSCVDDDDLVPDYYVSEILTALQSRPDYVGFQVQCYDNGRPTAIAYHSLAHKGWVNGRTKYLRDISHLNPIRRELALRANYTRARSGRAEDRAWVDQLRRLNLLREEVTIDRIMYHYLYSTSRDAGQGSRWKNPRHIKPGTGRAPIVSPFFSYHPRSDHD